MYIGHLRIYLKTIFPKCDLKALHIREQIGRLELGPDLTARHITAQLHQDLGLFCQLVLGHGGWLLHIGSVQEVVAIQQFQVTDAVQPSLSLQ